MNVLVTGANGFLGRHVVRALVRRGHTVRAMVRPATQLDGTEWGEGVEVVRAELRVDRNLEQHFKGMDALIHLAAAIKGDDEVRFASTVVGTERLLDAMIQSTTRRIILASSFSVYDWTNTGRTLTEASEVEDRQLYQRDGYAIAKVWQERVVRRQSERFGMQLTVLRPGAIWGDRNTELPDIGHRMGKLYFVIGPLSKLKLSYVENCAEAFVCAVENPDAIGRTVNVIDDQVIRNWRYAGQIFRRMQLDVVRIPIPYYAGLFVAYAAKAVSRLFFGRGGKLPSILEPCRFVARFKPTQCSNTALRQKLRWQQNYSFEQALDRTFEATTHSHAPRSNAEAGHA